MKNKIIAYPVVVFTTSNFPFGGAAENFVRQMALGLNTVGLAVDVVLMRGNCCEKGKSINGISYKPLLFKKRAKNEFF